VLEQLPHWPGWKKYHRITWLTNYEELAEFIQAHRRHPTLATPNSDKEEQTEAQEEEDKLAKWEGMQWKLGKAGLQEEIEEVREPSACNRTHAVLSVDAVPAFRATGRTISLPESV